MSNRHHESHHHFFHNSEFGTPDDDVLNGTNANDFLFGFGGDDQIFGDRGNDTVFGGRGNDRITGDAGNDSLYGESGNDGLAGGDGNDDLHGGRGRDFLVGGAGRDELTGGEDSDKFVIRSGAGIDTITDLHSNDRIDLRDFGFALAQDVLDAFHQQGHDAVLNLGNGDRLIIEDTRVSHLDAAQFIVSDAETGVSSSQSPYVLGTDPAISTVSLLTTGDSVDSYQMVGTPDGLGAFDNGDGTFTVLMNHEFGPTAGAVHAHGGTGSFVSKWVIDKTTLEVQSGSDLIQHVHLYDSATDSFYDPVTDANPATLAAQFNRFCSADLADQSAFYNADSELGYNGGRLFLNGEESGTEGRAFAHIASGVEAGNTYELAALGKLAHENVVANDFTGDKTVVATMDDGTNGQVYFYVGDKQSTGNAVEQAGLTGGHLFGLKVSELVNEESIPGTAILNPLGADNESAFTLVDLGDVSSKTGVQLDTDSEAADVTSFFRPEDGAWDTIDHDRFYFVTTGSFSQPSRLWAADFNNASDPTQGGTIELLLDGTEGQKMMDNITVNNQGHVIIQEDVGNNARLGAIWDYNPSTDQLTLLAQHDPDRFLTGGSHFLTQDEESSGVIDVTDILGSNGQNAYLFDVQAHYSNGPTLVEGGQLGLMYQDLL